MTRSIDAGVALPRASAGARTELIAVLGVALAALLAALGTFWDLTGNDPQPESHPGREYLVVLGIIVAVALACYGLMVRGAAAGNPGRRSVILGGLGVVSLAVFWAGAPAVLASAAVATALLDRDRLGGLGGLAKTGLVLAALSVVAATVLAVAG